MIDAKINTRWRSLHKEKAKIKLKKMFVSTDIFIFTVDASRHRGKNILVT